MHVNRPVTQATPIESQGVSRLSLKELRIHLGLNQAAMAERLQITQSHYSKYERGERRLTEFSCERIVAEFGVRASMEPGSADRFRFSVAAPARLRVDRSTERIEELSLAEYRAISRHFNFRDDVVRHWIHTFELEGDVTVSIGRHVENVELENGIRNPAQFRVLIEGETLWVADVAKELRNAADDARYPRHLTKNSSEGSK